jgi:hypothetical protein
MHFKKGSAMSEYLYLVQMDVPPELEADFNRIYDTQHIPAITKVPGVLDVKRYVLEKPVDGVPKYAALYRVTSPAVPQGPAWVAASDTGEWKPRIRPHTFNRKHALFKALP